MVLPLQLDRFIPNRSALDFDVAQFNLSNENVCSDVDGASPSKDEYQKLLAASLNVADSSRILSFKQKAPAPPPGHESNLASLYNNNMGQAPSRKHFRHVPTTQDRILDAPDIVDDYYLNLLDWSSQNLVSIMCIHCLVHVGRRHLCCPCIHVFITCVLYLTSA
jgi:cell division cycle protein 20 (cofactor of APC complex)